jgi:hypothetical protein
MRQVYDQLLTPIGGPASQKAIGLAQTLQGLLERAEEYNALKGASTQSTSQKTSRQSKKR